jgi:hypothetical protein
VEAIAPDLAKGNAMLKEVFTLFAWAEPVGALAACVICCIHLRLSRWMRLVLAGFVLLAIKHGFLGLYMVYLFHLMTQRQAGTLYSNPDEFLLFLEWILKADIVVRVTAWGLIVVGLGLVFADVRRKLLLTQGPSRNEVAAPPPPGSLPT